MEPSTPTVNGQQPASRDDFLEVLTTPLTEGYKATTPLWALETNWLPQLYLIRDVEMMLTHPIVRNVLDYFKGAISSVEFDAQCADQEVQQFLMAQCMRFWERGLYKVQGGYEYGWIGCENLYEEDGQGRLFWHDLAQFSPRDTFLLAKNRQPVGVRVKNVTDQGSSQPDPDKKHGTVDLFLSSRDVPAKGFWYPHNPRYSAFYGQSQLLGAWRPWRRLAWKDAAETVIDTAVYRFGFCGPIVRYPEEDLQLGPTAGSPATTLDSQGRPRRYARDVARQMAEWMKTGAGIGMPSTKYPANMGGGDKWDLDFPTHVINADPLINYAKYLQDQIAYGIGVPPELLQASETGSGYSGRSIPMEAFISNQQRHANAILHIFVDQVLKPLVAWNWGPDMAFSVKVKPLLQTKNQQRAGAQEGQGGVTAGEPQGQKGVEWRPYQDPSGKSGWISTGGLVRYGDAPPSALMSLVAADRISEISRRIMARRAA